MDFVRAQFPAFSEPATRDLVHFENAGGSWPCAPVVDRLTRFYRTRKMQPYWPAEPSRLGGEEMDEARTRLAAILGVDTDELSFGPSTTANTYVLAQAFAGLMQPGEAIVVTNQDHEANSGPWRRLADRGIVVREWRIDPATGRLNPDDLVELLDETVRLVCFPHCSNVVGEINPVVEITALAHAAGAFVCVDGVSYAPHGLPDVGSMGCDIYLFSAYKTFGPHQGIMTISRALGQVLPNQGHHFNGGTLYKRFTPAGPDHAQIAACAGIADYIDALYAHHVGGTADVGADAGAGAGARARVVHDMMHSQEQALMGPMMDFVRGRNDLRLVGPSSGRAPTVSLDLGRPAEPVAVALAAQGVMVGAGDFYAGRPLAAMGVQPEHGVLRISWAHYNTAAEMTRVIAALDSCL